MLIVDGKVPSFFFQFLILDVANSAGKEDDADDADDGRPVILEMMMMIG